MARGKNFYTVRHAPGAYKKDHNVLVQAFVDDPAVPGGRVYLDATGTGVTTGMALAEVEKVMRRHIKQRQDRLDRLQQEINDMTAWMEAGVLEERVK